MTENHMKPWTDDDLLKMFQIVTLIVGPYPTWKKICRPSADPAMNTKWMKETAPTIGALFGRTGSAIGWMLERVFTPAENSQFERKRLCLIAYKAGFLTLEQCMAYMEGQAVQAA